MSSNDIDNSWDGDTGKEQADQHYSSIIDNVPWNNIPYEKPQADNSYHQAFFEDQKGLSPIQSTKTSLSPVNSVAPPKYIFNGSPGISPKMNNQEINDAYMNQLDSVVVKEPEVVQSSLIPDSYFMSKYCKNLEEKQKMENFKFQEEQVQEPLGEIVSPPSNLNDSVQTTEIVQPPRPLDEQKQQCLEELITPSENQLEQLERLIKANPNCFIELVQKLYQQQPHVASKDQIDLTYEEKCVKAEGSDKQMTIDSEQSSQASSNMQQEGLSWDGLNLFSSELSDEELIQKLHEAISNPALYNSSKKEEMCPEHAKMRKVHYCSEDERHLCQRCIISDTDGKTYTPLSRIASEVVSKYSGKYEKFREQVECIQRIDAKNWKDTLRQTVLKLFQELYVALEDVKKKKLEEVNELFGKIEVKSVNSRLNELRISKNCAQKHSDLLTEMFETNKFSTITKRRKQYNILAETMNQLSVDCDELVELAASKRRKLDEVQDQVSKMVVEMKNATFERVDKLGECSIIEQRLANSQSDRLDAFRSGFYYFLKQKQHEVFAICPEMKYLEVVAFLQSKWEKLTEEEKQAYVRRPQEAVVVLDDQDEKKSSQQEPEKQETEEKEQQQQEIAIKEQEDHSQSQQQENQQSEQKVDEEQKDSSTTIPLRTLSDDLEKEIEKEIQKEMRKKDLKEGELRSLAKHVVEGSQRQKPMLIHLDDSQSEQSNKRRKGESADSLQNKREPKLRIKRRRRNEE